MKQILFLLVLFSLQSCFKEEYKIEVKKVLKLEQDLSLLKEEKIHLESQIQELTIENEELNKQINKYKLQKQRKVNIKYVWNLISYKKGDLMNVYITSEKSKKYNQMIRYSSVTKVVNMNNSKKYKMLDDLESGISRGVTDIIIIKRESFVFNSYEEASKHRYNMLN